MVLGFKLTLDWMVRRGVEGNDNNIKDIQKELRTMLEQMTSVDERDELINAYKFIGKKIYGLDGCSSEDEVLTKCMSMPKDKRVNFCVYFKLGGRLSYEKNAKIYWAEKEKDFPRASRMFVTGAEKRVKDKKRHAKATEDETPDKRSARLDKDKKRHAKAREDETPDKRSARLDKDTKRHAKAREDETPDKRSARLDKDKKQHVFKDGVVLSRPTFMTKSHERPGKDFSLKCGTQDIEAQVIGLYEDTGLFDNNELDCLVAFEHAWGWLEGKRDSLKKLHGFIELWLKRNERFDELMNMVFDESFRWEADELYRKRRCNNPITESEKLLMHFAESDSFSLDDCKANLPTHEDIEHEKFKEWAESLIGLRLSVPKYWWFNEETKQHFTSMDKYLCEVTYILSFDSENPLFNIYCEGDGHDYPMEYCDVWKYSAKEDKISFCLPTKPPRLLIDKRLSELKREILQKLDCPDVPNSSQEDYGLDDEDRRAILLSLVKKRANMFIGKQKMTSRQLKKNIAGYEEAEGLGPCWASLPTCACCGFRNLNIKNATGSYQEVELKDEVELQRVLKKNTCDAIRSYQEVDLGDVEVQFMLKMRDEDDAEDFSEECEGTDGEDGDADEEGDRYPLVLNGSSRTQQSHRQSMERDSLKIPYNKEGDTKEVELWRLCSAWPAKKPKDLIEDRDNLPDYMFDESGDPVYYHLHPEFVREERVRGGKNKYSAMMCSECCKVIFTKEDGTLQYPRRSIAAGVDFGDYSRIGLEPLTDRERQIISKVRHYLLIIKIESNTGDVFGEGGVTKKGTGRTRENSQSAVKGCGIYFDDDSTHVVSDLLSREGINGKVSLQFVGPEGQYDTLAAKVLGSPHVEGRAWVIYQWLKVLREVNCHYEHDDILPAFGEVSARMEAANEALVGSAECIDDEDVLKRTEIDKDDVRRVRTGQCGSYPHEDVNFPFRSCLLASSTKRGVGVDVDRDYLASAANALGVQDKKQLYASRRERDPLNDYENGDETLAKASPDVCIFGTAYGNKGPVLHDNEIEHLLMQYTTSAARNRPLLFQLFESRWRQSVIRGMHAKVSSNRQEFEQFADEFCSEEFQAKLIDATKNPKGRAAKYVLDKLVPLLSYAGRKSHFGALERNQSAGEILALGRFFGCASAFLTFGIDDVNHPTAIRFALRSKNNHDFPSAMSNASDNEIKNGIRLKDCGEGIIELPRGYIERLKLMISNPVGAAIAYKQVVRDVMDILFGKRVRDDEEEENIGMIGSPLAHFGKTETTGSGSLHFHVVLWGGLSPRLLESIADIPAMCKEAASVLDSQYNASVDRHMHVQDLVQKNIGAAIGLDKLCILKQQKVLSPVDVKYGDGNEEGDVGLDHRGNNMSNFKAGASSSSRANCRTSHDTSTPGAFAEYGKTLNTCQDVSCQHEECNRGWIFHGFKRSAPRPIMPSRVNNENPEGKSSSTGEQIWLPRVILRPPDPEEDRNEFREHVAITICRCGIHEHTWTCRKPPKGLHGCRLCYTRALNSKTKPMELKIEYQPDGSVEYDMLDPLVGNVDVDGTIVQQECIKWKEFSIGSTSGANAYPLQVDSKRVIAWELDRPELKALDMAVEDASKEKIVSSLYQHMLGVSADVRFGEGGEHISMDHVDLCQFCEQDSNNLFYCLLSGLMKSSKLKTDDKSIECLRRELMQFLRKMPPDCKLDDDEKTVEQHIESRMDYVTCSDEDKLQFYSQLMENATGDDCYEGGAFEVKLFVRLFNINVAVYEKTGDDLTRVDYIAAKGDNRPTIHLLRTLKSELAVGLKPHICPSRYMYELFVPKLKRLMARLESMSVNSLRILYKNVSNSLSGRNGWVVDYNSGLTSVLGCNSNLLHLGSTEQSKAALFYIGPYINKDGVKIVDALPILVKAHGHALNFPSVAEDSDSNKRHVQYVLTRALNKMNNLVEVSDTQVAASLLGMPSSICSNLFVPCDTEADKKFVLDELHRMGNSSCGLGIEDSIDIDSGDKEYFDENDFHSDDDEASSGDNERVDTCEDSIVDEDEESPDWVLEDTSEESMDVDHQEESRNDEMEDEGGGDFKYINACCGLASFYLMNDGTMQPVSYAALYRYRGEGLKHISRYEYKACVEVRKKDGRRKKCTSHPFSVGLGIENNYYQILRPRRRIPKFTKSPPAPPVNPSGVDQSEIQIWRKKADRFALFYLVQFRPEDTLYEIGQLCTYEYNWEAFVEFYCSLCLKDGMWLCQGRRKLIDRVMCSWRVDRDKRDCLTAFRGRNKTIWSDAQKEAAKSYYGNICRGVESTDDNDGMDYIPSSHDTMTEKQRKDIQKHICHGRELLDTLNATVGSAGAGTGMTCLPKRVKRSCVSNVVTLPFSNGLDNAKRSVRILNKVDGEEAIPTKFARSCDPVEKVDEYITGQNLSDDKNVVIGLVREHFNAICSGRAYAKDYVAPNLLVCGKPGNGKSKVIEVLDGIVRIMKVGEQMKCAYMGSAAVNIAGTTLLKPWDIPVFKDGKTRKFRPWNVNKLEALQRRFGNDFNNICAVVVDEVSTIQPYMLAYLNDRMQEIFQVFDKPFGGRMVILVGDFQQKPPTAGGKGGTLPGSVMEYTEKEAKPLTLEGSKKLGPTQMGGYLFSNFRFIELTSQHRSDDPEHMAIINKMSETGVITVNDLKTYKKLSGEDLAGDDFRFATIIVTGNLERRQINAWQARRWANHYGVSIIRWARKREEKSWKGKPNSMDGVSLAMQNDCFWELFIPGAKGYLNTYNINGDEGLANGTEIKYHSLSFDDRRQRVQLNELLGRAQPGDVIRIDSPPTAINVELFADFDEDTDTIKAKKKAARLDWLSSGKQSITSNGRVVIHVSCKDGSVIPFKTTYVPHMVDDTTGLVCCSSQVDMKDYFPVEPAFSITVDKAQGKTIHRIVLSVSEHTFHLNRIKWEDLYVALSRVRWGDHMRLLVKRGDWNTVSYVSKLRRDKYTDWYFRGYRDHPSNDGSKIWSFDLAREKSGLIGRRKFGTKGERKKASCLDAHE